MNKEEAKEIVLKELDKYRVQTYQQLTRLLDEQDDYAVVAPSGVEYQIEICAHYDDEEGGPIRVFGLIEDGSGFSSFSPYSEDFILSPDGKFIGE